MKLLNYVKYLEELEQRKGKNDARGNGEKCVDLIEKREKRQEKSISLMILLSS